MKGLVRALGDYADDVEKKVKKGVAETTVLLHTEASSNVKVDTGFGKNSIQYEFSGGGLEGTVIAGAHYLLYLEFGTGIVNVPLISDGKLKNRGKTGEIFNINRMGTGIYAIGIV